MEDNNGKHNNGKHHSYLNDSTIQNIVKPLQRFLETLNISSKLLLLSTIVAILWANSSLVDLYYDVWHVELAFRVGNYELSDTLVHWINDGLMVIFFFVIGLEIKRNLLVGELSSLNRAALPMIAAVGGVMVPACIYLAFNWGSDSMHGWGIPMATDIAFALGVVMALGKRIPTSLKIFLLALAIVDDLMAILVIALFYTSNINMNAIAFAIVIIGVLIYLNYKGIRNIPLYGLLGIALWLAFLLSGVHATIAGVLLAFTIPARARTSANEFREELTKIVKNFPQKEFEIMCVDEGQRKAIKALEYEVIKIKTPLQKLEDMFHPIAALFIIPIFALANAGVNFVSSIGAENIINPITMGVVFGLVIGKPIGITFFAWLGVKMGIAFLPEGVRWRQILGFGFLGGIGFTMSLFITNLAFTNSLYTEEAKIGILVGSLIAAIIGSTILIIDAKTNINKK
jgi:NhaA family Na+:H+ antiporter